MKNSIISCRCVNYQHDQRENIILGYGETENERRCFCSGVCRVDSDREMLNVCLCTRLLPLHFAHRLTEKDFSPIKLIQLEEKKNILRTDCNKEKQSYRICTPSFICICWGCRETSFSQQGNQTSFLCELVHLVSCSLICQIYLLPLGITATLASW